MGNADLVFPFFLVRGHMKKTKQSHTYSPEELEKLRSVAVFPQGKRLTQVTRTDRIGSTQTDHWDGRRDADVRVKAFRVGSASRKRNHDG